MTQGNLLEWSPRQASAESLEALPLARVREDHRKILSALADGGMTDAELLEATGINPNAVRARRGELVEAGMVRAHAEPTINRNGRRVTVWVRVTP